MTLSTHSRLQRGPRARHGDLAGCRGGRSRSRGVVRYQRRFLACRDRRDHPPRTRPVARTPGNSHARRHRPGVANAMAAIDAGASHVQGTMNGHGERTGNCNLTSIIPIVQLKLKGVDSCRIAVATAELSSLSTRPRTSGRIRASPGLEQLRSRTRVGRTSTRYRK